MPENLSVNNKRIAKNTLLLYIRMIVLMLISLYTVRVTLEALGVEDYGIYNVVGGVVAMFSFLKGAISTSSQRYFSIHLAKGDIKGLNNQFCLNINVYLSLAIAIVVVLETIGLWFLNNKLVISEERLFAANIVYQLSIIAFVLQIFTVPYNALIVAYEKMGAFAYISILEGVMKLLIAYVIIVLSGDKLIMYGLLTLVYSSMITMSYIIYCKRKLEGCNYHWYWNNVEVKELFGFTGWHFLGTTAVSLRGQGINILINMFFNPSVNAARAVAYQIDHALLQLSHNFFTAVKPQMYKAYANNEMNELYKLINRSTIISAFLMSLFSLPLIISAEFVLTLWLKEVPQYAVIFAQLVLIDGIISSTNGSAIAPALATGNIRKYQIIVSTLIFLNIPVSYIFLKLGFEPTCTMYVSIVLSLITVVARALLLIELINLPFKDYLIMMSKLIVITIFILLTLNLIFHKGVISFISLIGCIALSSFLMITLYWFVALSNNDRQAMKNIISKKITK